MSNPRLPALSPLQQEIVMLLAQHDKEHLSAILNDIRSRHSELSPNAVLLDASRALGGLAKLEYIDCEHNLLILKKEHFEDAGFGIWLSLSAKGRDVLNL